VHATCGGIANCPLRIDHPRNGTPVQISLGCSICRHQATF
jgi:hypothetical protein